MSAIFTLFLMSSQVFAQKIMTLSPNETKSLTNNYLWTLNATCNIQGNQATSKILVSVLENKCRVNGKNIAKGQATSVTVRNNESISVSAEPGTTVNLVNLSSASVQAVCSA